ncbi:MAG: hypothetical protein PHF86_11930 [Candidatus Nanoarchaeia archaeon]|nr:hypothetical protein [Candidatus Nanoarchaeia archaeon]
MKILKTILFGALLWGLIFFEVSILMFGFGLKTGLTYYIIHYLLSIILIGITTIIYIGKEKLNFKKGILVGIIFAITGVILDSVITVPLFVKNYNLMFGNLMMWVGILFGILTVGIVSAIKNHSH